MVLFFTLEDQVKWSDQFLDRLSNSQSTYFIYLEYHIVCPLVRFWDPPPPLPQANVSPPEPPGGGHTPAGEEVGGPNSDDWRKSGGDTLACGRAGGGSQLGRLEKMPGTLSTLWVSFERVLPVSAGRGSREGGALGNAHARCQGTEMWTRPLKIKKSFK